MFLPDDKHFLYQAATNPGNSDIYFASTDGKENRLLCRANGQAIYASGFLLYVRGTSLMAERFEDVIGTQDREMVYRRRRSIGGICRL